MIKTKTAQVIELEDWDNLVTEVYGKPYSFQQQDGCKGRGNEYITVPSKAEDYENDSIPEEINGSEMGVSFTAWLDRDPKEWNGDPSQSSDWYLDLFWGRNFYPTVDMLANDLHAKGLLPAGDYTINIDW